MTGDGVPAEPWLHPAVAVRTSYIAGRGLVATRDVAPGTVVTRFGGRLVTDEELVDLIAASDAYVDTLSLDADMNLVLPPGTDAGLGNHGCEPHLWWEDPFSLVTRRPIAAGDELLVDYGTITDDAGFRMPCRCGAALCRGVVTGRDWQLAELRDRYGDRWAPGLRRRIAALAT